MRIKKIFKIWLTYSCLFFSIIFYLNSITRQTQKSVISTILSYFKRPPKLYPDYKMNLDKIRYLLENPKCECRDIDYVCITIDEMEEFTIHVTHNLTVDNSYKMGKNDFEYSYMICNPFKVLRRGFNQKVISYSILNLNKKDIYHIKLLIQSAKIFFPKWIIRIYHDGNIDQDLICEL